MSYLSIFLKFLRFGCLAWGGPVAQINMLREDLVEREKWIEKDKFKRVLAVYQALPGPEAHELCVYFGMVKARRIGGLLAGLGFMLPGLVLMLLLAWAYLSFGSHMLTWFAGVAPAVTALIFRAAHRIGGHVIHGASLWIAALLSVALTLLGVHFAIIFIICAAWQGLWAAGHKRTGIATLIISSIAAVFLLHFIPSADATISTASEGGLFTEGLKAGMLSFGGAYTVIPFLKESMVGIYSGVTTQSFLDGIALSNVIPAPLVIFGTFLGFMAGGFWGALLVTAGIFLPAFAITLVGHKQLEKIINNPALHGMLDGISAGVVGLLAITALEIFLQSVTGLWQGVIFAGALAGLYLFKQKWFIPVLIIACAIAGQLFMLF
ncbi:MAG: chromate efflux transporter [Rickettsiales bacterium]